MTIVIVRPGDVIGVQPTTLQWLDRYGLLAEAVHELEIDTVRMSCKATIYQYKIDLVSEEVVITTDERNVPRQNPPYTFPIRDLPPGLERALRENVQSVTMPPTGRPS